MIDIELHAKTLEKARREYQQAVADADQRRSAALVAAAAARESAIQAAQMAYYRTAEGIRAEFDRAVKEAIARRAQMAMTAVGDLAGRKDAVS